MVCAAILLAMVAVGPFHTQDGPNHRLVAELGARLSAGSAEDAVYTSRINVFHTNVLFSLGYRVLSGVVSVERYETLFLLACLIALPLAYRWFLSVWAPHARESWVLCLPLLLHPLVVTGMYNFAACLSLTFVALALMRLGLSTRRARFVVAYAVVCWLAWLAHPFPFFVLGAVLLTTILSPPRPAGLPLVATGAITAFFLAVGFFVPLLGSVSRGPDVGYAFLPIPELLGGLFYYNFVGFSTMHLVAAVPLMLALVVTAWHVARTGTWPSNGPWVAMLVGYLVFPSEGSGGAHINERFLPFLILFLPVAFGPDWPYRSSLLVVALISSLVLGSMTHLGMRRIDREVDAAAEVLAAVPPGARLYPLTFDPKGPALTYSSLLHLWAVFDARHPVYSPYTFVFSELMPVSRRRESTATYFPALPENFAETVVDGRICRHRDAVETVDCPARRVEAFAALIATARYYDYWFVYAAPPDFERLLAADGRLELAASNGAAAVWHNRDAIPFAPPLPEPASHTAR